MLPFPALHLPRRRWWFFFFFFFFFVWVGFGGKPWGSKTLSFGRIHVRLILPFVRPGSSHRLACVLPKKAIFRLESKFLCALPFQCEVMESMAPHPTAVDGGLSLNNETFISLPPPTFFVVSLSSLKGTPLEAAFFLSWIPFPLAWRTFSVGAPTKLGEDEPLRWSYCLGPPFVFPSHRRQKAIGSRASPYVPKQVFCISPWLIIVLSSTDQAPYPSLALNRRGHEIIGHRPCLHGRSSPGPFLSPSELPRYPTTTGFEFHRRSPAPPIALCFYESRALQQFLDLAYRSPSTP